MLAYFNLHLVPSADRGWCLFGDSLLWQPLFIIYGLGWPKQPCWRNHQ